MDGSPSKPVLGYWTFRGLGQPIRLLLAYLEVDYENKVYKNLGPPDYISMEWRNEKFGLGLEFPNLPYWIDGDVKITEMKAILKYLARTKCVALLPTTSELQTKADIVEGVLYDLWWNLIRLCFIYSDEMKENFERDQPVRLGQVSIFLGNKKWILGEQLSYLDFLLYEVMYHHLQYNPGYAQKFSNFPSFLKNFESLPKISTYMLSSDYISSPCVSMKSKRKIV